MWLYKSRPRSLVTADFGERILMIPNSMRIIHETNSSSPCPRTGFCTTYNTLSLILEGFNCTSPHAVATEPHPVQLQRPCRVQNPYHCDRDNLGLNSLQLGSEELGGHQITLSGIVCLQWYDVQNV